MKGILICTILLLILNGCAVKKDRPNENLKECINEQILSSINSIQEFAGSELTDKNDFDFFDTIADFEEKLISENVLKNKRKDGYENLIDSLEKSRIPADSLGELNDQNSFLAFMSGNVVTTSSIFNYCPMTIVEKDKSRRITKSKNIFDKIQMKGYIDFIPEIREYSQVVEYNSDIERLQLTYLIFIYFNNYYWNPREERPDPVFNNSNT